MPPSLSPVVKMKGVALADKWLNALLELRVERQFQVPTRITLRFSDPGYALLTSSELALGNDVVLSEYQGAELAHGEITSVSAEQRPGEQPEVVVVALDRAHRMGRTTRIKVYKEVTYSDIVTKLAADNGLTASVDSTPMVLEYLMQAESDLALLSELARRTGFDWWVEGTVLHFAKPRKGAEVQLGLGEELRSFSARVTDVPQSTKVSGWDRSKQEQVVSEASSAAAPAATSDLADLVAKSTDAFGPSEVFTAGLGAQSEAEAKDLAQTVHDRVLTSAVTAKGVAEGTGALTPGAVAVVSGAGPLSGHYPVTEVEHVFRRVSGFVTRFTSGERRPTTLVDTLGGAGGAPAYAGPAHFRSGVTVGKVTNNKDPNNAGRVKVRFPGLSQEMESGWARVVSMGGGANRGSVWLPEIDDEVLVAFEGGDARQPVVIGGLYGEKATMPDTKIENGAVQSRALTSRLGHVIAFLDGTSSETQAVEIMLAGKEHAIHLGKDKLTVKVPSGMPVEISAGSTSLKFSESGDVTLEGNNITIKAKQDLKLQGFQVAVAADAALDIKAQAKLGVSGAMVEVQSQGPAKVAGTPVMIN